MFFSEDLWFIYVLIFAAALLAVQTIGAFAFRGNQERKLINRRLALSDKLDSAAQVVDALRRERTSGILGSIPTFDRLVTQSGVSWTPVTWFSMLVLITCIIFVPLGFFLGFRLRALTMAVLAAAALLY